MSERRILKLTIHEFDPTYKFLRVFIEDEYISIKNMVNCNVRFNTESKKYEEKKKKYTEEIEKIVKDEYDSFTKRNTEYKEKVLKADKKIQNRLIETFDDDDIKEEKEYIYQHQQAKLVTSAMACKYAENKGDIKKLMDSFEIFSNSMELSIFNSVKNDLSNFCLGDE